MAALLLTAPVTAQERGYEISDRQELTIEHTPSSRWAADRVASLYVEARRQVEARLNLTLPHRPHAVVAATDEAFEARYALETGGRKPGKTVLAVAFSGRNLIIIRQSGIQEGTNAGLFGTLKHELAHLALGVLEEHRGRRLPRWLNEGLAEYAAGRVPSDEELSQLANWSKFGQIPDMADLAESFPDHGNSSARTYTVCMAFVVWISKRVPIPELIAALGKDQDVDAVFERTLDMTVEDAELEWREELAEEQSFFKTLFFNMDMWGLAALLCIVAGLRVWWVRRRQRQQLAEEEQLEDQLGGMDPYWMRGEDMKTEHEH